MDLFDVLSMDERIIVYSSLEDGVIYTWNNSDTFQCCGPACQSQTVMALITGKRAAF